MGGFGKAKTQIQMVPDTGVTFNEVAGCDGAKLELAEVVDFLKQPEAYTKNGCRIPRGVILSWVDPWECNRRNGEVRLWERWTWKLNVLSITHISLLKKYLLKIENYWTILLRHYSNRKQYLLKNFR